MDKHTVNQLRKKLLFILGLIIFALAIGCQPTPAVQKYEVVIPEQLDVNGTQWKQQEWSESVNKQVDAYFKKSPYLADNPSFNGQKVCYTDGSRKVRCYWVQAAEDKCQWIMIEFVGTQVSGPTEGVGEPFTEMKAKE